MTRPDEVMRVYAGYRMRRATSALLGPVGAVLAPFGLRRTTFTALSIIAEVPGLTQARLAEAMAVERPNLVQIVRALEEAGLVTRAPADGDRRAYALHATEAGRRVQARAARVVAEVDAALLRGLSPAEVTTLQRALATIERNAEEMEDDHAVSRA